MYAKPIRSDELYHYGVLGMKWGQHKAVAAARSHALNTSRNLNKLQRGADSARAYSIDQQRWAKKYQMKAAKYATKSTDALIKGNTKRADRLDKKFDKAAKASEHFAKKSMEYSQSAKKGYDAVNKILNTNRPGVGVVSKQKVRAIPVSREAYAIGNSVMVRTKYQPIVTNKYKAKVDKQKVIDRYNKGKTTNYKNETYTSDKRSWYHPLVAPRTTSYKRKS